MTTRKTIIGSLIVGIILLVGQVGLWGHEMRPAFLELRERDGDVWEMTWKVPARGPDERLALDVRLPGESQWTTMPVREFTGDAFIDRAAFSLPGGLDGQEIYIEGLLATFTDALVRIERLDGSLQSARLEPSTPSLVVEARPDPGDIPRLYFLSGLQYLEDGWDHFAFALGLVALAGSISGAFRAFVVFLVLAVSSSALSVTGVFAVSPRWTEVMLAVSLLVIAMAIARTFLLGKADPNLSADPGPAGRETMVFGAVIGIVHGFGFAGGFPGTGATDEVVGLICYLGGIVLGLSGWALGVLLVIRFLSRRSPARSAVEGTTRNLRIYRAAAYALGIAGVFLALQRW